MCVYIYRYLFICLFTKLLNLGSMPPMPRQDAYRGSEAPHCFFAVIIILPKGPSMIMV